MTLEQCWHKVPGGTAVAAIETARAIDAAGRVALTGVVGRHRRGPTPGYAPPVATIALPVGGPLLYESWLRFGWPKVESVLEADVVHATTIIPPATDLPLVVTIHDLAFLRHPEFFTGRGNDVFRRSLERIVGSGAIVACSSKATLADCAEAGLARDRLHHVPLGVRTVEAPRSEAESARARHGLPERFALFVGTLEPRKNLRRLAEAVARVGDLTLVVVGAHGWGDATDGIDVADAAAPRVVFLGHLESDAELAALYRAADVFCYPSIMEGYGLPVLEAMAQGTPVVTSATTSTAEVAAGAAVLVEPTDVDDIARGIRSALAAAPEWSERGRRRALEMSWDATASTMEHLYSLAAR
jgi:glycosyltransferase involved in cell wall biosynthesis